MQANGLRYRGAMPRLFVSYSHDSREHEDRVCALADRLREDGIDTVIDQYDTVPPGGWAMWGEREIRKADFVALVCTPTYLRRVEEREEPGKGRGVLWEAKLIYNHLYAADTAVQRFIPILMEGGDVSDIPWPLRGLAHYRVDTPQGYDGLYRHLSDQRLHEKPLLGKLKPLPAIAPQSYASSLEARLEARGEPRPLTSLERRNRQQILKRVRLDWIEGVLNQSLYQVARMELGLKAKTDAVEQPLNAVVQVPDRAPNPMAPGTAVSEIFDAHGGALLILGAPGTGKTTLLLELARELLDRAEHDESHLIPIVFNLSSWAVRRPSLEKWLVAELTERSDVPKRLGQQWVETEQIIPLLDGLDEVAVEHRRACVEAINNFRRDHGLLPMAVCSRIADYEHLGTKLRLRNAIAVQPLTKRQVQDYLERVKGPAQILRAALEGDDFLWELLETPLMLWVAMLAYRDADVKFSKEEDLEQRRRRLFTSFVDAMFKRRSARTRYTRVQTLRWLTWLASTLKRNNQTIFYLESLRPEAFSTGGQRWLARAGTVVASCLAGSLVPGLAHALIASVVIIVWNLKHPNLLAYISALLGITLRYGLVEWAPQWLGIAVSFGVVSFFLDLRPTETMRITAAGMSSRLGRAARQGLFMGLTFWLGLCPLALFALENAGGLKRLAVSPRIQVYVALGFPSALLTWRPTGWLMAVLGLGLLVVPVASLVAGVVTLLSSEAVEARRNPNEGTQRSIRKAMAAVLILGLSGGLIGILVSEPALKPGNAASVSGLLLGLSIGLSSGLLIGMITGGLFSLRHFAVRLTLLAKRLAPLGYARFLDYAVERLFLRKVGGGYIFVHRMVLEYFASLGGAASPWTALTQSRQKIG